MTTIKAIETSYKGYRFRSRLEARWAVFFDALGLRWHYELEGFNFDELCYLPDFYLPDWDVYLEVKPDMPTNDFGEGFVSVFDQQGHTAIGKFILASLGLQKQEPIPTGAGGEPRPTTKLRLYMLCGTPGIPSLRLSKGRWELVDGSVALALHEVPNGEHVCPVIDVLAFAYTQGGKALDIWPLYCTGNKASGFERVGIRPDLLSLTLPGGTMRRFYVGDGVVYNHLDLVNAYRAARSARFEHGEKP